MLSAFCSPLVSNKIACVIVTYFNMIFPMSTWNSESRVFAKLSFYCWKRAMSIWLGNIWKQITIFTLWQFLAKKTRTIWVTEKKNTKEFMENQNQIIWAIQWNQINYNKYLYLTNSSLFQILSTSRMKQTFHCQLNRFFTYTNLTRLGYDAVSLKKIILTYITYTEDKSLQYVWYTVNF